MNKLLQVSVIPDALIQDESISMEARFLYVYLSSFDIGRQVTTNDLSLNNRLSIDQTVSIVNELRLKGWLSYKDGKGYTLYQEPIKR